MMPSFHITMLCLLILMDMILMIVPALSHLIIMKFMKWRMLMIIIIMKVVTLNNSTGRTTKIELLHLLSPSVMDTFPEKLCTSVRPSRFFVIDIPVFLSLLHKISWLMESIQNFMRKNIQRELERENSFCHLCCQGFWLLCLAVKSLWAV